MPMPISHLRPSRLTSGAARPACALAAGFTLVEIMIVMVVVGIMFMFIVGIVVTLVDQKRRIESRAEAFHVGPTILRIIARDLEGMYVYQLDENPDDEDPDDNRRNYFVGEDGGSFDPDPLAPADCEDTLHFVTTVDSTLRIGTKQADVCEVGYYLEEADDEDSPEGTFILYRREDFHVDKNPVEGGKAVKLYDRMRAISFRYYPWPENPSEREDFFLRSDDPEDDWDNTEEGALPMAVEVTVWIDVGGDKSSAPITGTIDEDDRPFRRYQTLVMLPHYPSAEEQDAAAPEEQPDPGGAPPPSGERPLQELERAFLAR